MAVLKRILSEGFRVFFLFAGLYGIFTGLVWAAWLLDIGAGLDWTGNPRQWHAHEMIFGYAGAALGGFFLTAVPNWTNTPAARPVFLGVAAGLWLAGRVGVWLSGGLPAEWVMVMDLAFVPVLALKIAGQLIKRPKPQNMMFLAILALLWVSNLMVHLEWIGITADTADIGLRGGVFALVSMIVVLGGRITPAFTRNAMKRAGLPEAAWPVASKVAERGSVVLGLLLPVSVLVRLPDIAIGLIAAVLGLAQLARLARWRGLWALVQPILFALHLALGVLGTGLILWGAAKAGIGEELAALHVIGIGGVGGMTLAVMSRAALGHSGRPLVAPRAVAISYGVLAFVAFARWAVGLLVPESYTPLMAALSLTWAVVFGLYTLCLWPALTQPRVDASSL